MPAISCPDCGSEIGASGINVATDVAYCTACNRAHPLSTLAGAKSSADDVVVDPDHPPRGAWFRQSADEVRVGVSLRHISVLAIAAFAIGWNGFLVHFFGFGSSSGQSSGVPWLFMVPFVAVGIGMIGMTVLMSCGKSEVTIRGDNAVWSYGVAGIGLRRRFLVSDVLAVERDKVVKDAENALGGRHSHHAIIRRADSAKSVRIWLGANENRATFVIGMLRALLIPGPGPHAPHRAAGAQ